jgi:hypothetical protein
VDCTRFRELFDALPSASDEDFEAWAEHERTCRACSDAWIEHKVRSRGADPGAYPCVHLALQSTHTCPEHPDPRQCPEAVVVYEPRFREWGLPIRAAADADAFSYLVIRHCPWCGVAVPPSLRDAWHTELAHLGFPNPLAAWDDLPEAFLSDTWWRERS